MRKSENSPTLELLPKNRRGMLGVQKGSYSEWKKRAEQLKAKKADALLVKYCLQKSYFDSTDLAESFFRFSTNVVGREIEPDERIKFFAFITNPKKYKMLQAARGSWKSSICVVDFTAWLIARDYFIHNGVSNIRIALASETLNLARRNVRAVIRLMRKPSYIYLGGDHKAKTTEKKPWGVCFMMSDYRPASGLFDPTLMPMSIDTEATGFHFDYILGDDVEAERSSATREMIENVMEYIRLLYSIMDPRGHFYMTCTRWHEHDAYSQIEKENEFIEDKDEVYDILKIPACDDDFSNLRFPSILDEKKLRSLARKQTKSIFSSQYLLNPRAEEDKVFKGEWLKSINAQMFNQKLNRYITADIAFTERSTSFGRRDHMQAAYSVVLTVAVDERWNYFVEDYFREQCAISLVVKEIYKQWQEHEAICAIMQKVDARGIREAIEQEGYNKNLFLPVEWVAYPGDFVQENPSKIARIATLCEPRFRNGHIFLHPGMMEYFAKEEYLDFPHTKYKDTLDALCNVIKFGRPPSRTRFKSNASQEQRDVRLLKMGYDPVDTTGSMWDD